MFRHLFRDSFLVPTNIGWVVMHEDDDCWPYRYLGPYRYIWQAFVVAMVT